MSLHKLLALNLFHLAAEAHTIIIVHHTTMNKSFDERHLETLDSKTSTKLEVYHKGVQSFWKDLSYFYQLRPSENSDKHIGILKLLLSCPTGEQSLVERHPEKLDIKTSTELEVFGGSIPQREQSFWKDLSYF